LFVVRAQATGYPVGGIAPRTSTHSALN